MPDETDVPWRNYYKDRLSKGLTYVVGRDVVERNLRLAGAKVASLSFSRPDDVHAHDRFQVFDVYWVGDGGTRIYNSAEHSSDGRLLMRWTAVPSSLKPELTAPILDTFLPEACRWAAAVAERGNTWKATDHRWMLTREPSGLVVTRDLIG